jgi:hypothetical protein
MTELEHMSIDDVDTANRWLDANEAAQARAAKRARGD